MKNITRYASNRYIHYGVIAVVCYFSFFVNNQVIPAELMEARNLATAQEMVTYGNYLIPTMNGELRFEKPPMPTWIAAGIEHVLPGNIGAQRYAAGLAATLMMFFLYLLIARLTSNRVVGFVISLIAATTINVIMGGRAVMWDIYTHSFMLGAIYFMFVAFKSTGAQWRYFLFAGLFAALSFLSKGPESMYKMLLPFLIGYFIVYHTNLKEKKWSITGMVLVFAIFGLWWHGYIFFSTYSEFAKEVMHKESGSWFIHNVRQWYYYWRFSTESGIWMPFWLVAIVYYFVNRQSAYRKEYSFSFIWFLAALILLSVVPEKKTRYLLPLLIPGSMMIGFYLYQMMTSLKTRGEIIVFRTVTMMIAVIMSVIPILLYILVYKEKQMTFFHFLLASSCCWLLCIYLIRAIYGKKGVKPVNVFIGCVLTMLMATAIYFKPVAGLFLNEARNSIRLLRDNKALAGIPFYYNEKEALRMELVYEANRRFYKLNPKDDESIEKALPFVFISGESIEKLMEGKNVSVDFIGAFDNNWNKKINILNKKENKRHNPDLVREVAVIRAKTFKTEEVDQDGETERGDATKKHSQHEN